MKSGKYLDWLTTNFPVSWKGKDWNIGARRLGKMACGQIFGKGFQV